MWYLLIHFDGIYVSGFICPGEYTKKQCIQETKKLLAKAINILKLKVEKSTSSSNSCEQTLGRLKAFMRTFKHPWRKTKRGDSVLEFRRLDGPMQATYWLDEILTQQHACNVLPKQEWDGTSPIE